MIILKIRSADLSASIRRMQNKGIILHDILQIDAYSATFCIQKKDLRIVQAMCRHYSETLEIHKRNDFSMYIQRVLRRPMIVIGAVFLLLLTVFLQNHILFVQVEGNNYIPAKKILEAAARCGIHFGADSSSIRSEETKNALMGAIPQLQWVGVKSAGCVATISVVERKESDEPQPFGGIAHLVARTDGVIERIIVTRGNALCKVGDSVKEGQILISGYFDYGLSTKMTGAEGEVYAFTKHHLHMIAPSQRDVRTDLQGTKQKFFLIIGKKRINFSNSSGILGGSCAKIYKQKYITLPGGFVLPICLVTETWHTYGSQTTQMAISEDAALALAEENLKNQMIGGRIVSRSHTWSDLDGVFQMDVYFGCLEMIGKIRNEEIMKEYEDN